MSNNKQARYWSLTLWKDLNPNFSTTELPDGVEWMKGQLETTQSGRLHYQVVCCFKKKLRTKGVQNIFGRGVGHFEPSRSKAIDEYVWKKESSIEGTQFELGTKPFLRSSKIDWERSYQLAKEGKIEEIPPDMRTKYYNTYMNIAKNNVKPEFRPNVQVYVYWGNTGKGKSWKAFNEDNKDHDYYVKDPTTKWWDGYQGEDRVIIDEFRGKISIEHMLRWLCDYPVSVEIKGGKVPLKATKFWITSNLHPEHWYIGLDGETEKALLRRLTEITEFK